MVYMFVLTYLKSFSPKNIEKYCFVLYYVLCYYDIRSNGTTEYGRLRAMYSIGYAP